MSRDSLDQAAHACLTVVVLAVVLVQRETPKEETSLRIVSKRNASREYSRLFQSAIGLDHARAELERPHQYRKHP